MTDDQVNQLFLDLSVSVPVDSGLLDTGRWPRGSGTTKTWSLASWLCMVATKQVEKEREEFG